MQHDDVRVLHAPQHLDLSQNLEVDALFLGTCHPYFFNGDLQIVLLPRRLADDAPLAGAQRGADGVLVHRFCGVPGAGARLAAARAGHSRFVGSAARRGRTRATESSCAPNIDQRYGKRPRRLV